MPTNDDKTINVWLVEDSAMFATSVRRVVNGLDGMTCGGLFTSVETAFAALHKSAPPDVILLDVQLPGMDGIAALATFRELAPEAQVVILTVFDDPDKIFRAVCVGASGYILKSSGIDQIGQAIQQVVAGGAPMTPEVAQRVLDTLRKRRRAKRAATTTNSARAKSKSCVCSPTAC